MKRWAVLTVLLYALALSLLTVPALWLAFHPWKVPNDPLSRYAAIFQTWWYWLWVAVLVAGQALLLLLPLEIAERRFIPRRTLKIPCLVTGFLLANLLFAGLIDVLCAGFKEQGLNVFSYLIPFNPSLENPKGLEIIVAAIVTLLAFWIVWTIVFRHFADSDDPDSLLKRSVRWLLAGSILELLVAVPSHVIVRRRGDCCAPAGTFWGIATGISIMLLCFGPGVFFLFAERFRRLQPKDKETGA
ncbi:MAG: hypothetical protein KGJ88_01220 [Verrucomicrobiota bacterium]|nr:hypothetical protein [Verrucomicrobiota bacterium]